MKKEEAIKYLDKKGKINKKQFQVQLFHIFMLTIIWLLLLFVIENTLQEKFENKGEKLVNYPFLVIVMNTIGMYGVGVILYLSPIVNKVVKYTPKWDIIFLIICIIVSIINYLINIGGLK